MEAPNKVSTKAYKFHPYVISIGSRDFTIYLIECGAVVS
jgi:hypothetical protein